jgi:hypothetical protein
MEASERREAALEFLRGDEEVNANEELDELEEEELEAPVGEVDDDEPVEAGDGEEEEPEGEGEAEPEGSDEEGEEEEEPEGEGEEEVEEEPEIPEKIAASAQVFDQIAEALMATDYPLPLDPVEATTELAARLTDANSMYAIVAGAPANVLFDRIEQFQGKPVLDAVITKSILPYLVEKGYIEGPEGEAGAGAGAGGDKGTKTAVVTPGPNPAEEAHKQQGLRIFTAASTHLKTLAEADGYDQWTFDNVLIPAMASAVAGNKVIHNRIAMGKYVDIDRIYTETKNKLVGQSVARSRKTVASRKVRDKKIPRTVAGGSRSQSAEPKFDLTTREGRMAAAKAELKR